MGYRGKLAEQEQARRLRAQGATLGDIAAALGVAKSSVSLWVRDVEFQPRPRSRARRRGPNALQRRKQEQIQRLRAEGAARIGTLSEREFLVAGAALYAGEGSKRDGKVVFANSDPRLMAFFCAWLRRFFDIEEQRLRAPLPPRRARPGRRHRLLVAGDRRPLVAVPNPVPSSGGPDHPHSQARAWLCLPRL